MKLIKIMSALFGTVFLLLVSVIVYAQISNDPRGIIDIEPSPDKQTVAYSYYDSGGGGGGYCSYGIDLVKLGGDIQLFTFHAGQKNIFEAISCDEGYGFKWVEKDKKFSLEISCPDDKYQKTKLDNFQGIKISYKNC